MQNGNREVAKYLDSAFNIRKDRLYKKVAVERRHKYIVICICTCGEIQTERQIVNECVRTRDVRMVYDDVSRWPLLFHESDMSKVATFLYECLRVFE